jgi:hypothetical protein
MQYQVTARTPSGGTMITGASAGSRTDAALKVMRIIDRVGGSALVTHVRLIGPPRYRDGA